MANPILSRNFNADERVYDGEPMTINGAINKTLTLLALAVVAAGYTWWLMASGFTLFTSSITSSTWLVSK